MHFSARRGNHDWWHSGICIPSPSIFPRFFVTCTHPKKIVKLASSFETFCGILDRMIRSQIENFDGKSAWSCIDSIERSRPGHSSLYLNKPEGMGCEECLLSIDPLLFPISIFIHRACSRRAMKSPHEIKCPRRPSRELNPHLRGTNHDTFGPTHEGQSGHSYRA